MTSKYEGGDYLSMLWKISAWCRSNNHFIQPFFNQLTHSYKYISCQVSDTPLCGYIPQPWSPPNSALLQSTCKKDIFCGTMSIVCLQFLRSQTEIRFRWKCNAENEIGCKPVFHPSPPPFNKVSQRTSLFYFLFPADVYIPIELIFPYPHIVRWRPPNNGRYSFQKALYH